MNNPGPAAIGAVFYKDGQHWKSYSKKLPQEATNNQAEFEAALFVLAKLKQLIGKQKLEQLNLTVKSDSTLLVKQLSAKYKIQEPGLQQIFLKIWNSLVDFGGFGSVKFELIPREKNKAADKLVRQALQRQ